MAQLAFSAKLKADPPAAGGLATIGRTIDEWKLLPGRENHFLDCCVLATVAASAAGITAVGAEMAPEPQRRRVEVPKPGGAAQDDQIGERRLPHRPQYPVALFALSIAQSVGANTRFVHGYPISSLFGAGALGKAGQAIASPIDDR